MGLSRQPLQLLTPQRQQQPKFHPQPPMCHPQPQKDRTPPRPPPSPRPPVLLHPTAHPLLALPTAVKFSARSWEKKRTKIGFRFAAGAQKPKNARKAARQLQRNLAKVNAPTRTAIFSEIQPQKRQSKVRYDASRFTVQLNAVPKAVTTQLAEKTQMVKIR